MESSEGREGQYLTAVGADFGFGDSGFYLLFAVHNVLLFFGNEIPILFGWVGTI